LASIKEIFVAMSRAETNMLIVDPFYEGCTEMSMRGRAAMYAWLQKLGLVDVVIPAESDSNIVGFATPSDSVEEKRKIVSNKFDDTLGALDDFDERDTAEEEGGGDGSVNANTLATNRASTISEQLHKASSNFLADSAQHHLTIGLALAIDAESFSRGERSFEKIKAAIISKQRKLNDTQEDDFRNSLIDKYAEASAEAEKSRTQASGNATSLRMHAVKSLLTAAEQPDIGSGLKRRALVEAEKLLENLKKRREIS